MASPTSNEFEVCRKIAVDSLQRCLGESSPRVVDEACWQRSLQWTRSCHEGVHRSHAKDPARERAERAARAQAEEAARKKSRAGAAAVSSE